MSDSASEIRSFFETQGYCIVRSGLSAEGVASFASQLESDLAAGRHSEERPISLSDPSTWPNKKIGTHRVVEVVPPGDASAVHWSALRNRSGPLASALDALLGPGAWSLPLNGDSVARHWYAPVTFPEAKVPSPLPSSPSPPAVSQADPSDPSAEPHVCLMSPLGTLACSSPSLLSALSTPCSSRTAASLWQPINRRRVVGRGWHLDVGPGFPNTGFRTCKGDVRQGVVLLLLLSDWPTGGGGTVIVPGSHGWAYAKIKASDEDDGDDDGVDNQNGLSHERLNEWLVKRMRVLAERSQVNLYNGFGSSTDLSSQSAGSPTLPMWGADGPSDGNPLPAIQITGLKGDIVLLHPLLAHSGTMNLSAFPRLLANGMAVSKIEAFEKGGCKMMQVAANAFKATCRKAEEEYRERKEGVKTTEPVA